MLFIDARGTLPWMAFMELCVTAKSSDSKMAISLILLKPDDLLSPCYAHSVPRNNIM